MSALPSQHQPNLRHLEIHVTYRCVLRCFHCSNNVQQAPSNETMPYELIENVIHESVRLNWPWEWLVLHGGEAALHPKFEKICQLLAAYKKSHNPSVKLFCCSSGWTDFIKSKLNYAQSLGFGREDSGKNGDPYVVYHVPISNSPVDNSEDYYLGCFQTSKCGIAVNTHGFYPCSPMAASQRLFGYEPLCTRLEDVTTEKLAAGFALACQHCGYARVNLKSDPHAAYSPTWLVAMEKYKSKMAG